MKVIYLLSMIIIFAFLFSCTTEKKNPIEGAWQLVEGKYVSADTTVFYPAAPSENSMKVISKSHFATVTQDTVNATTFFNGGSYTFENGMYTEYLAYFSSAAESGITSIFIAKFEADRLFLLQSTADGKEQEFGTFEEWKRLENSNR